MTYDGTDKDADGVIESGVKPERLFTEEREPDIVVTKESGQVVASGRGFEIASGQSASNVIQEAIDKALELGGGMILCKGQSEYKLDSQVRVKSLVNLSTGPESILKNTLSDTFQYCIVYEPGSQTERLRVNANQQQGVKFGEGGTSVESYNGLVDVVNAGKNFDSERSPIRQSAIAVAGFDIIFKHIHTFQGNAGLFFNGASDVYIQSCLMVNASTGVLIDSSEHIFMPIVDIDSSTRQGLVINSSQDIRAKGSVWFNGNEFTASPLDGIAVGEFSTCLGLELNFNILDVGDKAVHLHDVQNSDMRFRIADDILFTDGNSTTTGIKYESSVGDSVSIDARISDNIPTKVDGQVQGTFNGIGVEFANSETPTTSKWDIGIIVEFTDTGDGSGSGLYLLLPSQTWAELSI